MSATALAIAEASRQAIYHDEVIQMAQHIVEAKDIADEQQMIKMLFHYSAQLTAVVANLVTNVLLTEEQLEAMMSELKEFDELGKEME